jgi:hypothetical protein
MVKRRLYAIAPLVLALALHAQSSWAEPPPNGPDAARKALDVEARAEFARGLDALHAANWELAEKHFQRSLDLVARPSTRYNLAFVLFQQGRAGESQLMLEPLLARGDTALDRRYQEYAEALAARIRARSRSSAEEPSPPARVDPRPASSRAPAKARSTKPVATAPEPARSSHSPALSSWGPWVSVGVGGALLVAAGVTGLAAFRADQRFKDGCPDLEDCDPSLSRHQDDAERLGRVTDVLLAAGTTFVVGGLVWRVATPSPSQRHHARGEPWMLTLSGSY